MPNAPPDYGGSLFVSDLASGLYVTVTPLAPLPTSPILVPVQGTGVIGVTTDASGNVIPIITDGNTTGGSNDFGGRIIRILPNGTVNTFAYGFDTNGAQDSTSFINSMLTHQLLGGRDDAVRLGRPGDLAVQDDGRPGRARRAERWSA